eukprot:225018-Chlamydomonas_euryale.AAC.1
MPTRRHPDPTFPNTQTSAEQHQRPMCGVAMHPHRASASRARAVSASLASRAASRACRRGHARRGLWKGREGSGLHAPNQRA